MLKNVDRSIGNLTEKKRSEINWRIELRLPYFGSIFVRSFHYAVPDLRKRRKKEDLRKN